ncbi:plasmid fertility inhibition factor family protein [Achromobacter marplatensis]|uniref:plasmid fertility inhibition factor family protein n=1 Tax=Achromobacter marplatensis TaxID=470868 RepID=UPI0028E1D976|nr:hypothetical protein [Achromobacter marplatensis]
MKKTIWNLLRARISAPPVHTFAVKPRAQLDPIDGRLELASLTPGREAPLPKKVYVDPFWAIWELQCANASRRYMCVSQGAVDDHFVVHVSTDAFYRLWLETTLRGNGRNAPCPLREHMPRDYKFSQAELGFSHGIDNPVPLAEVSGYHDASGINVAFINGVTRSLWLIANEVASFPVKCYSQEEANLIHAAAGCAEAPVMLKEIFAGVDIPQPEQQRIPKPVYKWSE